MVKVFIPGRGVQKPQPKTEVIINTNLADLENDIIKLKEEKATIKAELDELKLFLKNIDPLLDILDNSPILIKAILNDIVNEKIAKAAVNGKLLIQYSDGLINIPDAKKHGLIDAWHLVYYLKGCKSDENTLESHIIKFKENLPKYQKYVESWSKWVKTCLPDSKVNFDYILRVRGSTESIDTNIRNNLDILGEQITMNSTTNYRPNILKKSKVTPELKKLGRDSRRTAIKGCYYIDDFKHDLNNKNVLIIDDIYTTGETIAEIVRVLKKVWPYGKYYFFSLGYTPLDYSPDANDYITSKYFE